MTAVTFSASLIVLMFALMCLVRGCGRRQSAASGNTSSLHLEQSHPRRVLKANRCRCYVQVLTTLYTSATSECGL